MKQLLVAIVFLFSLNNLFADVVDKLENSGWTYYGKWTTVTIFYDTNGDGEADWMYHKTVIHIWGGKRIVWLEGSGPCMVDSSGEAHSPDGSSFPEGLNMNNQFNQWNVNDFIENPLPVENQPFDTLNSEYEIIYQDSIQGDIKGSIHKIYGQPKIEWIDYTQNNKKSLFNLENSQILINEYPDYFEVSTKFNNIDNLKFIRLYNINGGLVQEFSINNYNNQFIINKNNLNTGTYFIVFDVNNSISTKKISVIK